MDWFKENGHAAIPYAIDFDYQYPNHFIYSGGFDRKLKVHMTSRKKELKSIKMDKEVSQLDENEFLIL